MVLGKLIGKKKSFRENLGIEPAFQSFNDSGSEFSHAGGLLSSPVHKPTRIGRAETSGARLEGVAEQAGTGERSNSIPRRLPLLRAPSGNKLRSSEDASDDENSTDEQSSGSEYSGDDSSCSSDGSVQIPEQFHISRLHMACVDQINAPIVVPGLLDDVDETRSDENEGTQLDSSLLHFTPYLGEESQSANPDDTQSGDILELPQTAADDSMTTNVHRPDKPRQTQRRLSPNKNPGSRLKRKEKRSVKSKRDSESADEADVVLPANDQPLVDHAPQGAHGVASGPFAIEPVVPETTTDISSCPRSPAKILRAFKRTSVTLTPKGIPKARAAAPGTPSNRPLRPLSDCITCPKTNQQLPILNPLDSSNPSATPVQYAVELHRQTPVKQRQKYVLGESMTKPIPCAEIAGFVPDQKQTTRSRRGSLSHIPRPQGPPQARRLSCPLNATDDEDDNDHEDNSEVEGAFERVMGLIDSHTRVAALDMTEMNSPTRKKKPTVEDMKRKVQKDREKQDEKMRNSSDKADSLERTSGGAKRLQSPRRSSKGRAITARRQGQLVSTVSFDPTK